MLRLLAALSALLVACAPPGPPGTAAPAPNAPPVPPGVVVDAAWLREHHGHQDLVVLDSREPEAFAAGHLPGAASLWYRETYDERPERSTDLAPMQRIAALLGAAGVDRVRTVVIYGDGEDYRPAAWLFWVLEVHGHRACAVLDGGLPAWAAAGGAVTAEPSQPAARTFVPVFDGERLADKLEVVRAMQSGSALLLDARSPEEYSGEKSGAFARAGHIPTAINLPATAALERSQGFCELQGPHELAERYAPALGGRIYAYCGTGRSAAVSYLALRSLGADVAVYDGSWTEWSADRDLPVALGERP